MSNINKIIIVFIVSFIVWAAFNVKPEMNDKQIISAAPVPAVAPAPVPTPPRALTAKEQTFIDQACADSVNQSMYDTCKKAVLDSWDTPQ